MCKSYGWNWSKPLVAGDFFQMNLLRHFDSFGDEKTRFLHRLNPHHVSATVYYSVDQAIGGLAYPLTGRNCFSIAHSLKMYSMKFHIRKYNLFVIISHWLDNECIGFPRKADRVERGSRTPLWNKVLSETGKGMFSIPIFFPLVFAGKRGTIAILRLGAILSSSTSF